MRYYRYEECGGYDFASIVVADLPDGSYAAQMYWEDWPRATTWMSSSTR
jgi:hypothetical protein